ncbi:hypothetical protein L218DRAFT_945143 [Marasmius fiardii PR-910]|nr:hypothetical protein L218DRAFT_945143 [Marasmius fiardii PR-910]
MEWKFTAVSIELSRLAVMKLILSPGNRICKYDKDAQKCVGRFEASSVNALNTVAESNTDRGDPNDPREEALPVNAKKAWGRLKRHVLEGVDDKTGKTQDPPSGRHLASALIAAYEKNPQKVLDRTKQDKTGLSRFMIGNVIRTTWDDDLGKYTVAEVEAMCVEAIRVVLKMTKKDILPSGAMLNSVSVRSPRNTNICITVQGDTSCFPGSIEPTKAQPGEECEPDS